MRPSVRCRLWLVLAVYVCTVVLAALPHGHQAAASLTPGSAITQVAAADDTGCALCQTLATFSSSTPVAAAGVAVSLFSTSQPDGHAPLAARLLAASSASRAPPTA